MSAHDGTYAQYITPHEEANKNDHKPDKGRVPGESRPHLSQKLFG